MMGPRDLFLAVTAAIIWGATFPISAIALESTPPIFFAFLRFLCAAVFVMFVPRPPIPWTGLVLAGLLLGAGQYGFMFVAMTQGVSAGLASLLVHTQAFFTIGIAMIVFAERPNRKQVIAVLLALAGLVCLVINRSEAGALTGLALILIAALCGACGNNLLKSFGRINMLGVAVWMSLVAPLPLAVLSFLLESDGSFLDLFATVDWVVVLAVLYSAILATIMVFAIWGRLLTTYATTMVAPFFLLVPVFGFSLSAIFLGERPTPIQIVGGLFIFAGLAMALWPDKSRE